MLYVPFIFLCRWAGLEPTTSGLVDQSLKLLCAKFSFHVVWCTRSIQLSYHRHIQISGSLRTLGIEPRSKINAVISYVNLLSVPPTPCTLFCRPDVPIFQGAFISYFTKISNLNICCVRLSIHFVLFPSNCSYYIMDLVFCQWVYWNLNIVVLRSGL